MKNSPCGVICKIDFARVWSPPWKGCVCSETPEIRIIHFVIARLGTAPPSSFSTRCVYERRLDVVLQRCNPFCNILWILQHCGYTPPCKKSTETPVSNPRKSKIPHSDWTNELDATNDGALETWRKHVFNAPSFVAFGFVLDRVRCTQHTAPNLLLPISYLEFYEDPRFLPRKLALLIPRPQKTIWTFGKYVFGKTYRFELGGHRFFPTGKWFCQNHPSLAKFTDITECPPSTLPWKTNPKWGHKAPKLKCKSAICTTITPILDPLGSSRNFWLPCACAQEW